MQAVLENPYYGWVGEERPQWSFRNMSCAKAGACEHFSQVVWAQSCAVGCGLVKCDRLKLPEATVWTQAYFVVCNYGPRSPIPIPYPPLSKDHNHTRHYLSGNVRGQSPFLPGNKCSSCPQLCRNGLCRMPSSTAPYSPPHLSTSCVQRAGASPACAPSSSKSSSAPTLPSR